MDEIPDVAIPSRVLAEMGVPPDFKSSPNLRYIHKHTGETDVYFVANPEPCAVEAMCTFRVSDKLAEAVVARYRPHRAGGRVRNAGRMHHHAPASIRVARCSWCSGERCSSLPVIGNKKNWDEFKPFQEISGPWEVSFDPKWGGPAKATFDKLDDWLKRPEDGIRYYSGTAVYHKTFTLQQASIPKRRLFLDCGKIAVMAEVKLNGRELGVLWKPPYRVEITDARAWRQQA